MSSAPGTKKAAFQILSFLASALEDGSVKEDDKEGLEVAGPSSLVPPLNRTGD